LRRKVASSTGARISLRPMLPLRIDVAEPDFFTRNNSAL
jgi:hypothetical protein